MTKRRTAASLIASGAATITLDQRMKVPRFTDTRTALRRDQQAIKQDAQRALRQIERERIEI